MLVMDHRKLHGGQCFSWTFSNRVVIDCGHWRYIPLLLECGFLYVAFVQTWCLRIAYWLCYDYNLSSFNRIKTIVHLKDKIGHCNMLTPGEIEGALVIMCNVQFGPSRPSRTEREVGFCSDFKKKKKTVHKHGLHSSFY